MRMRRWTAVLTVLMVAVLGGGCATTKGWQPTFEQSSYRLMIAGAAHESTQNGPRGSGLSDSAVQSEVDRLLALKPRSPVPARVLLYQVPSSGRTNITGPLKKLELRQATGRQMRKTLEGADVFRSVDFLPEILLPAGATADLRKLRLAAARAQADAVLIYSTEAGYEETNNAWALLYLTIVGGFIAPGTQETSMAVSKAVLLDVATGYIYFVTEDFGQESEHGPAGYMDPQKLEYDARLKSVTELSSDVATRVGAMRGG